MEPSRVPAADLPLVLSRRQAAVAPAVVEPHTAPAVPSAVEPCTAYTRTTLLIATPGTFLLNTKLSKVSDVSSLDNSDLDKTIKTPQNSNESESNRSEHKDDFGGNQALQQEANEGAEPKTKRLRGVNHTKRKCGKQTVWKGVPGKEESWWNGNSGHSRTTPDGTQVLPWLPRRSNKSKGRQNCKDTAEEQIQQIFSGF